MKIWQYLGVSPEKFRTNYLETRLVDVAIHPQFPLKMFTYGREAVHTNNWDSVIRKCRGIIFDVKTDDIIARPFEKFFNLGTANMPETDPTRWEFDGNQTGTKPPEVWEKMDGFLCTAYTYNGETYIASKGSFDSVHARWATNWYRNHPVHESGRYTWPAGYTPVFEGICSSIRIVVDYENFEGLVLLALVNNETGEEMGRGFDCWAYSNNLTTPKKYDLGWKEARNMSLDVKVENFEGYVLVWRRPGQTPFRLKVKYVDYLRLHRMVSGVSAKAIYRGLSDPAYKGELKEWIDESTPWFSKFVSKWVRALQGRHDELMEKATRAFKVSQNYLEDFAKKNWDNPADVRKAFALEFQRTERNDIKGILFAMYDGKDASAVAWKLTKPMIKSSQPMIHGKDLL
jgi:RNA ligase